LGLPGAPRIKFIKGEDSKSQKNQPRALADMSSDDESDGEEGDKKNKKKGEVRTKYDRMFERRNQGVLATTIRNSSMTTGQSSEADEQQMKMTIFSLSAPL